MGWDISPASRNAYMRCGAHGGLIVLARSWSALPGSAGRPGQADLDDRV